MPSRKVFRFGVPSLDLLLGKCTEANGNIKVDDFGIALPSVSEPTSLSLIGPDGSGKSVLALHLASRFYSDNDGAAKVIYVSTDLSFSKAEQVWNNFALGTPQERQVPFAQDYELSEPEKLEVWRYSGGTGMVGFDWYSPEASETGTAPQPVEAYLNNSPTGIAFVDLASASAGDDWGFLCRMIASLEAPSSELPRHLLIVDAIEGFEMYDGDNDEFGQRLSRRGRISQIMRLAALKCHVVLVVEEARAGERGPEEFVTDAVIRFRHNLVRGYSRRMVEVEKVRGQSHIRGEHPYTIRKGEGSTTRKQTNHDDPLVEMDNPRGGDKRVTQSYVQVFPSVHCQSREFMRQRFGTGTLFAEDRNPDMIPANFGIPFLDELLVPSKEAPANKGLPFGTVTAVIGDPHTHKGRLGRWFLAAELQNLALSVCNQPVKGSPIKECGGCVLVTSHDTNSDKLAEELAEWFLNEMASISPDDRKKKQLTLKEALEKRIVCRRLEVHDIPGPILLHIIDQAITGARRSILSNRGNPNRIRVVLDDFSTFTETYPDIRQESLFLPALLFRLRRAGAATLIVNTSAGRPDSIIEDRFENELRALVQYRLYTWRVPFFGESRIAIAPIPPLSAPTHGSVELAAVIRELRWTSETSRPQVDPHFEMYRGLEEGHAEPVPLEVRLYNESATFTRYLSEENAVWNELFTPANGANVLVGLPPAGYDALHDFSVLQQETRLDHTLVLQVDDFWSFRRQDALRDRRRYLLEDVTRRGNHRDSLVDPFGVFQPAVLPNPDPSLAYHRSDGFRLRDYDLPDDPRQIDRVPFTWDFGFLLCKRAAWEATAKEEIPRWQKRKKKTQLTVGKVWAELEKGYGQDPELGGRPAKLRSRSRKRRPSWRNFLGACKEVARAHPDAIPFDLASVSSESFCCLVLEIWFSEILERLEKQPDDHACQELLKRITKISQKDPGVQGLPEEGLIWAIQTFSFELYRTWLLLVEILPLDRITKASDPFGNITGEPDSRAVATRHWYKTACAMDRSLSDMVAVGLPGRFSVRGDWFLAVAGASRSVRLADRACDLLSSRRGNFARLQLGMGLPVRDIVEDPAEDDARIRTALRASTIYGASGNVVYRELCGLGATDARSFSWLWRSELKDYDLHSRLWQKWLLRVCIAWAERRGTHFTLPWVGGFTTYDHINEFGIYPRNLAAVNDPLFKRCEREAKVSLAEWERRHSVSHGQFEDTLNLFENLCESFTRLAKHTSSSVPDAAE